MHNRKLIRDRVGVVLGSLSASVFTSRIYPLADAQLPAIKVYLGDEELVEEALYKGVVGVVSADLKIDCVVKVNDTFDDSLDAILLEVQGAMRTERSNTDAGSLPLLTNLFHYSSLEDVEFEMGETDTGGQSIIYKVHYEQNL